MKWILHTQTNCFDGSDELSADGQFFFYKCLDEPILFYISSVLCLCIIFIFLKKRYFCEAVY